MSHLCVNILPASWQSVYTQAIRSALKTSVASSWHFISTYHDARSEKHPSVKMCEDHLTAVITVTSSTIRHLGTPSN